jgi:septal ring-binding cell division protein DamX
VVAILAAAAYGGFIWWQGREADPAPAAAATAPAASTGTVASTPADTGTIVPAADVATTTTAPTATQPVTSTVVSTAPLVITSTAPLTPAAVPASPVAAPAPASTVATTSDASGALPVVRPRTAAGRGRLDDMAREYAASPRGAYTVQIQILCDPANLEQLVRTGGTNVWFVPQTIGARPCYRVFWGNYASREEAQRALGTVPAGVRDRSAAVKPVPRQQ